VYAAPATGGLIRFALVKQIQSPSVDPEGLFSFCTIVLLI
jgi:hypothetical protein